MSVLTERVAKPYPEDIIEPANLPDVSPEEHPTPWRIETAENNHIYLYDANNIKIAHVSCWDDEDDRTLEEKVRKINSN